MDIQNASFKLTDHTLHLSGDWTAQGMNHFSCSCPAALKKSIDIDGQHISHLDSTGVWWIEKIQNDLKEKHVDVKLINFSPQHEQLFAFISKKFPETLKSAPRETWPWVARVGKMAVEGTQKWLDFVTFVGEISVTFSNLLLKPWTIPWRNLLNVLQYTGVTALPIVGLLSFLIGIVVAYQAGMQLRNYGANVYIVDLLGLGILREFGPLITAIIMAGRSGSAFTAQIGTMQVNQEIDALYTMGIRPVRLLVMPKLLALVVALPFLTVWANILGTFGGMMVAKDMLNINFYYFLHRFHEVVPFRWYMIGLVKTPIFALIIASVGCYEGMKVQGSAESVGNHTTKSVVQAIFLIITADALFSVLTTWMKL